MVEILLWLDSLSLSLKWYLVFSIVQKKKPIQERKIKVSVSQWNWRGAWLPCAGHKASSAQELGLTGRGCTDPMNSPCPSCQLANSLLVLLILGFLNTFGKGENICTPMYSIVSGLLGFVKRLNKLWIHFSLLLTNVHKYNSEAKWTCSLTERNKHQTHFPYYISQSE